MVDKKPKKTKKQLQNQWELEQMHGDIRDPNPEPGGPPKPRAVPMPDHIKKQLNDIIIRKNLNMELFKLREQDSQDGLS